MAGDECAFSLSAEEGPPGYDGFDCPRETWNGTDYCVLHANSDEKPLEAVAEAMWDSEPIDGALLPIDLAEEFPVLPQPAQSAIKIQFHGANLAGVCFEGTDLREANFQNAVLHEAKFENADLNGADFRKSNLWKTEFHDSEFYDANFEGAMLGEAEFHDCLGPHSNFRDVKGIDSRFYDTNIWNSDFSNSHLERVIFSDTKLFAAELTSAILRDARFEGSNVARADLLAADLRRAKFDDTNLHQADFTNSKLQNADLRGTRLDEATFSDATINPGTQVGEHYARQEEWEAAERSYRALRRLAQENALPDLQAEMYWGAKEAERKQYRDEGPWYKWALAEGSRWVMGYGEKPSNVVATAVFIFFLSAALYPCLGLTGVAGNPHYSCPPDFSATIGEWASSIWAGVYFSAVTFSTVGYGDLQPAGFWAEFLAAFETLAGVLLAALLVFVLGRRATR